MFELVGLGELLIDLTPSGTTPDGIALLGRNPGGSVPNMLCMFSKLGGKAAFIGKVGDDSFGHYLKKTLLERNINCDNLFMTSKANTTLGVVQLEENGDRSFCFYRKPGADMLLEKQEVPPQLIKDAALFHFCSIALTDEPCRSAALYAVETAKAAGCIISYDPNYRPFMWPDETTAVNWMQKGMTYADIAKVTDDELALITGEADAEAGARKLIAGGASLALVSMGAAGALACSHAACVQLPTYDVATIDTTGAGDSFLGTALYCIKGMSKAQIAELDKTALSDIVSMANAAGSMCTIKRGGIPALPDIQTIEKCRKEAPLLKI